MLTFAVGEGLVTDDNCVSSVYDGSWSPDAQRLAYSAGPGGLCQAPCPDADFFTVELDGTGRQQLPAGLGLLAWSPDGTRIAGTDASGGVSVMNVDGTAVTPIAASGSQPDWQPVLSGYPRSKGASPISASLVPAFNSCTSPNRAHGPPLGFGACNPPSQTSAQLTVGTPDANARTANSIGRLRPVAVGEVPINLNNGNQSDLTIDFSLTDVRRQGSLSDYSGELRAEAGLRITDRQNSPYPGGPGPGTVADTSLAFNVPCAATADTTVGSTCSVSTAANALIPGWVLERQRAIWALGQSKVYDGGADGLGSATAGNTLFATSSCPLPIQPRLPPRRRPPPRARRHVWTPL